MKLCSLCVYKKKKEDRSQPKCGDSRLTCHKRLPNLLGGVERAELSGMNNVLLLRDVVFLDTNGLSLPLLSNRLSYLAKICMLPSKRRADMDVDNRGSAQKRSVRQLKQTNEGSGLVVMQMTSRGKYDK